MFKSISILVWLCLAFMLGACQKTESKQSVEPEWINNYKTKKLIRLDRGEDKGIESQKILSPDSRFMLYQKSFNTPEGYYFWQIWIKDLKGDNSGKMIYEYGRYTEVLWSPDSRKIIINDHGGSDFTEPHIMVLDSEGGISKAAMSILRETEKVFIDTTKNIWEPCCEEELARCEDMTKRVYHHFYVECIGWSPDSSTLLVKAYGHGGVAVGYGAGPCYFIYSINDNKVIQNLNLFKEVEK